MDIYLKKRWDLIPNITKFIKDYDKYEKNLVKEIMELKNNSYDILNTEEKLYFNNILSNKIEKVFIISETYSKLKASKSFMELYNKLVLLENEIANTRRYYNSTVRKFNNKIQMFPSNIIAYLFKFKPQKMFESKTYNYKIQN